MGFSPTWLALREPADHRSRDRDLETKLTDHLAAKQRVAVLDIGCGTGSNIRALAPKLGPQQAWTLVDYDAALLKRARTALRFWCDRYNEVDGVTHHWKDGREIAVRFVQADLIGDFDAVFGPEAPRPDLVTASAFFDLAAPAFVQRVADATARWRAAFFTVLTYNGINTWTPMNPADDALLAAFNTDQRTDKGLGGLAAGPDAPDVLAEAFKRHRYRVATAPSPWVLEEADRDLITELAAGYANACIGKSGITSATAAAWLKTGKTGCVTGHTDTLALPS